MGFYLNKANIITLVSMLFNQGLRSFLRTFRVAEIYRRNLGLLAVSYNKVDPIQKIFLEKVQEYKQLSESQGGGPVDVDEEYNRKKSEAIARLANVYNVKDPEAFPTFEFKEPDLTQDEVNA